MKTVIKLLFEMTVILVIALAERAIQFINPDYRINLEGFD